MNDFRPPLCSTLRRGGQTQTFVAGFFRPVVKDALVEIDPIAGR